MDGLLDQIPGITRELVNYGPYAILAIFLFIIAPKYTKRFIDNQDTDPAKRRLLCSIASGSWLVVLGMCVYIYINWSPLVAYQGSLGIHDDKSVFYTIDPNSYIASNEVHEQLEWVFAYISESGAIKKDDRFRFIHEYENVARSYSLPASALKKGKVFITANRENPSQLMLDADNDPQTDPILLKPVAFIEMSEPSGGFMAAYAAPAPSDSGVIIRQLSSPNRQFQALGRRKLQPKSIQELQQLLKTPNISEQAKRQIQAVIDNR